MTPTEAAIAIDAPPAAAESSRSTRGFWALIATVFLLWPGLGVNWFGAGGNPNDSLANLSFSHERLQYELSQFLPLVVIVVIGAVFYLVGGKARQEVVTEPITGLPAGEANPAAPVGDAG